MKMSEKIGEVAMAMAKAQGTMRAAQKDRENPFFKSSYATLASVIEAIREPFSTNNLAFSQPTHVDDNGNVFVTTIIMHGGSGEWISGETSAKPVKNDPQGVGSLISYLKRYGLQAIVGIASEDDDANAATKPHEPASSAQAGKSSWQSRQPQDDQARQAGATAAAEAAMRAPPPPPDRFKMAVPAMQHRLKDILLKRGIDTSLWEVVAKKMEGKEMLDRNLAVALKEASDEAIPFAPGGNP